MGSKYAAWSCYVSVCCALLGAACGDDDTSIRPDAEVHDAAREDAAVPSPDCSVRLTDGSYLEATESADALADEFTTEMWLKLEGLEATQTIIAAESSEAQFVLELGSSMVACASRRGSITARASQTVGAGWAGTWHHVACVRAADELALFLDGVKEAITRTPPRLGSPAALRVGAAMDGTRALEGELDELRMTRGLVYSDDFTPQRRYQSGGPATVFHFDECQGSIAVAEEDRAKLEFQGTARWSR